MKKGLKVTLLPLPPPNEVFLGFIVFKNEVFLNSSFMICSMKGGFSGQTCLGDTIYPIPILEGTDVH